MTLLCPACSHSDWTVVGVTTGGNALTCNYCTQALENHRRANRVLLDEITALAAKHMHQLHELLEVKHDS